MITKHILYRSLLLLPVLFCALVMSAPSAHATGALGVSESKEAEAPALPVDSMGRSTPRGTVVGFLDSIGKEDFEKASEYLDLATIPQAQRKKRGAELAKELQVLLDKGGWFFPSSMLSNDRDGRKDEEGIADGSERIGNLRGNGRTIDIVARQEKDSDKNLVWLISADTLDQLPLVSSASTDEEPLINKILPDKLIETKLFGAPAGHWIAVIFLFALSYLSVWFVVLGLLALLKKIWTKKCSVSGTHFLDAVRVPVSLYIAVWVFSYSSLWLGLSIIVRQHVTQLNVIVAWFAIALLVWRLIDIFAEAAQNKIIANGRFFGISSILFFARRIVKVIFGIFVLFIVLDNLGVDVTAGLAALGIGGIALALGAQKTLENFIGSLSIVIDQPVHIGDFCKIGDVVGTVEDIGMRSTRIRTNDRTLVTIPNGDLSNQRIENMARRNRFLVNTRFQLRYDAPSEKLRLFAKRLEEILYASEFVTEEGFPVRYHGPGEGGHMFELFFYINVTDFSESLRVKQELMLKLADIVDEMGLYYIIPSQTMLPAVDQRGLAANVPAAARVATPNT